MLFTDTFFLFYFLPLALVLHRLANFTQRTSAYAPLAAAVFCGLTFVFYAWEATWWLVPLAITLGFDYLWARAIAGSQTESARRLWLAASVTQNLGLLFFLKYWPVIVETTPALRDWAPHLRQNLLFAALPLGVSFFVLESLSFVIDVYRRKIDPPKTPLPYFAFLAMFPRFIAGPIVRYGTIASQIENYQGMRIDAGLRLFVIGLALKILIADQFAYFVPSAFERASAPGFLAAWLGVGAYSLQLYFDFSGYSLMAMGLGRCFGFDFPRNFDRPYLATSVQEFWTRWHITLGNWVRDYIFLPLTLRFRGSATAFHGAVVATWLAIGIWHGPSWTYVVMGLWFAACFLGERRLPTSTPRMLRRAITLGAVAIGWVLFRAGNLAEAGRILGALARPDRFWAGFDGARFALNPIATLGAFAGLVFCFGVERKWDALKSERPSFASAIGLVALFALSLVVALSARSIPFLYFRF